MPRLLGIECGATHTVALHESGGQVARDGFGPANLRLLDNVQLARRLRQIAKQFPKPSAVAIGMAVAVAVITVPAPGTFRALSCACRCIRRHLKK